MFKNFLAPIFGWLASYPNRLRILTFHDICDNDDVYSINPIQFANFVSILLDEGYHTINTLDLAKTWPMILNQERNVILTFDDGYAAHSIIVAELLTLHGMTGVFFVISSLMHKVRSHTMFDRRSRVFLSCNDIRQMESSGFEIGSHTHTHPMCGQITQNQFYYEATISKRILEDKLEHSINSFSYPFGRRGAHNEDTRAVLSQIGYQTAFTQEGLMITSDSDLLRLPRININRYDTEKTFRSKLTGKYNSAFS